ncbi:hypothetical protein E4U17_002929 [Claviceps sp. LM77 group G4]|nr:hypothetical protein E4U17_002929 [Claviceps sp. LM77 group G4]KAG6081101.1 hypothetical protein E4U16_007790 [Claviceps sp. LM84 group G4]
MSMMVPSIFSASINRAAALNNRGGSSIRGRASHRHGLDVSRHDLEDGRFHAQRAPNRFGRLYRGVQNRLGRLRQPRGRSFLFSHQISSTDSLETTLAELERVEHHSENGARSSRGLGRLFNLRRRHKELMGHRDRTVGSLEGRVATPYASENGDDDKDSGYEPLEEFGQNRRSDGWNSLESSSSSVLEAYPLLHCSAAISLRRMVRLRVHSCMIVSVLGRAVVDTIAQTSGFHIKRGFRMIGCPSPERRSLPLHSDDNESPLEYDDTVFVGSPLYSLHNGMLLDIHHMALQADDFIRYYGDDPNRIPRLGPRGRAYLESRREDFAWNLGWVLC